MKLVLNSTRINGYDLNVVATKHIADDDMSGQSSTTETAENGVKPTVFSCTINIKYSTPDFLTQLNSISQATDKNGVRIIYDIVNETAKALNVRQVRFTETVSVRKIQSLNAWQVSFSLREYQSVSEKTEERSAEKGTTAQTAAGDTVAATDETDKPQSGFERLLQGFDNLLAGTPLGVSNDTENTA